MFERISVLQAKQLIDEEKALVADIRDPGSYSQGHIAGALRLDNSNLQDFLQTADKSLPLIVCCYHGNSSQPAAQMLGQQGFTRSYSMDGGMSEWVLTQPVVSD